MAGIGFAAGRLMDGDIVGAGMELTSGALSTVPGLGTAASFGVDAALVARDINKQGADDAATQTPVAQGGTLAENVRQIEQNPMVALMTEMNETMKNLNAFLQANGEITENQAAALHKVAKNINDQQRLAALPGTRVGS